MTSSRPSVRWTVVAVCALTATLWVGRSVFATSEPLRLSGSVLDVKEHRLRNGLRLLLVEDHDVPSVSYFTFFDVGSRDERPGITGISHLFEHMMFNGARKYGPKEFDRFLERGGGVSNAYTTRDYTAYHETFPPEALPMVLDLEADRMSGLDVRAEMLESEREVVLEERYFRIDDNPEGSLDERVWGKAFDRHPYRWPILGWTKDISGMSRDACMEFYREHYAPNRATVVIVGDFSAPELIRLAERAYGAIPPQPLKPRDVVTEPPQKKEKRLVYRRASEIPIITFAYKSPAARNPDTLVLDAIQYALGEGRSSRLHHRLVYEEEIANWVYVDFPWHIDPALFSIGVGVKPGVDVARVEAVVDEEIDRLIREGLSGPELGKVRRKLEMAVLSDLSTNGSRAETLGTYHTLLGDWRSVRRSLATYHALGPAEVKRVAARYLKRAGRTVAILEPKVDARPEVEK